MNYLNVKETAEKWGVNVSLVRRYCTAGRIQDAVLRNGVWCIPEEAVRSTRTDFGHEYKGDLAILWGEFIGDSHWSDLVDSTLKQFIDEAPDERKDDDFYGVNPKEDRLWELLHFEDCSFFGYNMDKLLCSLVDSMVHHGTAYFEIVTWENQDKELVGLSFVPINPIISIKTAESTLFASVQYDKIIKFYKIHNSRIIRFRLKDVGFSRHYLYRLLRKLRKYDVTNVGDMSLSPQNSGFDFTEYVRKREFGLLKVTRRVGWYGRNGHNQHMGEGYLLYRIARAKTVRLQMLDYLLQQINGALKPLGKELGFSGSIIVNSIDTDFSKIFDKMEKGETNYSQVGDIVICRLGYER